jgi:hypothetical protein
MKAIVNEILSYEVGEVISTPLSLKLLKCYSALFLQGGQPRFCARSQTSYYQQIKLEGLKRAELLEAVQMRTCKPKFEGIKWFYSTGENVNDEWITDEQAISLLNRGLLTENDFITLPINYNNEVNKEGYNTTPERPTKQKHKGRR